MQNILFTEYTYPPAGIEATTQPRIKIVNDAIAYTPTFFTDGTFWERTSVEMCTRLLNEINNRKKPGESLVFIDIGAQIGLYTLLAKFYPDIIFEAFEPIKESVELMRKNIEINDVTNVHVNELCVSDSNKKTFISKCRSHNGLHTLGDSPLRFNDVEKVEVETRALPTLKLIPRVGNILFLKVEWISFLDIVLSSN